HTDTLSHIHTHTAYFGLECAGPLLKLAGSIMDPSLFIDTQLGTGDGGVCISELVIERHTNTINTHSSFHYMNETIDIHIFTDTNIHTHTHTLSNTHAYTHRHTHTHIHTYTHISS